jgi:hypothetical protein
MKIPVFPETKVALKGRKGLIDGAKLAPTSLPTAALFHRS